MLERCCLISLSSKTHFQYYFINTVVAVQCTVIESPPTGRLCCTWVATYRATMLNGESPSTGRLCCTESRHLPDDYALLVHVSPPTGQQRGRPRMKKTTEMARITRVFLGRRNGYWSMTPVSTVSNMANWNVIKSHINHRSQSEVGL